MGASDYVLGIRSKVGHDLLVLPGASAVILDERGRILLGSHLPSGRWGLIGGAVEPEESPLDAVQREAREELSAEIEILALVGAYGGPEHTARYPNGDVVSYVLVVYLARPAGSVGPLEADEIARVEWFERSQIEGLTRSTWIDVVIDEALAIAQRL